MMETLFLTMVAFLLAVLAMALGVIVSGKSLKGSCGGPTCKCVAEGDDVLSCDENRPSATSLPMHSSQ